MAIAIVAVVVVSVWLGTGTATSCFEVVAAAVAGTATNALLLLLLLTRRKATRGLRRCSLEWPVSQVRPAAPHELGLQGYQRSARSIQEGLG